MQRYELKYWPGSGEGFARRANDTAYWASLEQKVEQCWPNDFAASRWALRVGLHFNSDGVELMRVEANGLRWKCYIGTNLYGDNAVPPMINP